MPCLLQAWAWTPTSCTARWTTWLCSSPRPSSAHSTSSDEDCWRYSYSYGWWQYSYSIAGGQQQLQCSHSRRNSQLLAHVSCGGCVRFCMTVCMIVCMIVCVYPDATVSKALHVGEREGGLCALPACSCVCPASFSSSSGWRFCMCRWSNTLYFVSQGAASACTRVPCAHFHSGFVFAGLKRRG